MKTYFSFNPDYYDFWPVYEAIKTYYPIGLRSVSGSGYPGFEGQKKLTALLTTHVHDPVRFEEFSRFSESVGAALGYPVTGTTYGQEPSLSFELVLETKELAPVEYHRKLCVAISLLGKFYVIYGTEETVVKKAGDPFPRRYQAMNVLTVSPEGDFQDPYLQLKQLIRQAYPGYRQVPFSVLEMYLHGLYNRFDEFNECTIYNALFNQQIEATRICHSVGNARFAFEEWLKDGVSTEDLEEGQWISLPPYPPYDFS